MAFLTRRTSPCDIFGQFARRLEASGGQILDLEGPGPVKLDPPKVAA